MIEPKLRFKADDESQFPEWEEKKLGDITEEVARKDANSNADVRMISQGNGFILQSDKYSRENAGQSLKKYTLLKRDEFAYNHGASKVKPYGVCYRLCESDEARVPYVYHTFKLIDGDSAFWNYSLNTSCMDRQLKKMVSSGARMDGLLNIGYDAYMSVNIHVPSLPEQQKIAEFLSTIDKVIEKQKETVSAWEERKKGVMQKLFSQEVRFKADDGSDFPEWAEKKLGDDVQFLNGRAYKQDELLMSGKYLVLRVGNLFTNDSYYYSDLELDDDKYIENGNLIYAWSATFGPRIYHGEKCIYHYHIWKLKFDENAISKMFLNYCLLHDVENIKSQRTGGTMVHITKNAMENRKLYFPCLAEQQKIADCLSSLDEVIEKQKATLAAWEELKIGLLQQMFV